MQELKIHDLFFQVNRRHERKYRLRCAKAREGCPETRMKALEQAQYLFDTAKKRTVALRDSRLKKELTRKIKQANDVFQHVKQLCAKYARSCERQGTGRFAMHCLKNRTDVDRGMSFDVNTLPLEDFPHELGKHLDENGLDQSVAECLAKVDTGKSPIL